MIWQFFYIKTNVDLDFQNAFPSMSTTLNITPDTATDVSL